MEIILASWIGSFVISIVMGNIVGSYYLEKNNESWVSIFEDMKKFISNKLDHS